MNWLRLALYYGMALAVGFFLGTLQHPHSDYYLDGEEINIRKASSEFMMENIEEIRAESTVDLNQVPNTFLEAFVGFRISILPSFTMEGDISTPSTAGDIALMGWIVLVLLGAGGLHAAYRKLAQS